SRLPRSQPLAVSQTRKAARTDGLVAVDPARAYIEARGVMETGGAPDGNPCRSSVRRCCRRDLWSREGPAHKARGLTMSVFTFRPEPTGRPLLADEFWRSAIDQYHQR